MTVSHIWAKHNIKPHRLEGYIASKETLNKSAFSLCEDELS